MMQVEKTLILEKILLVNKILINNFSELFSKEKKKEVESEIKEAERIIEVRKNGKT